MNSIILFYIFCYTENNSEVFEKKDEDRSR